VLVLDERHLERLARGRNPDRHDPIQPFPLNVARVSAMEPDSSACSCARYSSGAAQLGAAMSSARP
jgi:hypothetical protein